ncbi:uncharacterized protein RCO7_11540 [Rhynchosporium graminicola]|uniref:HAT C-terminal dimerisation domain-containing protein n=1 Tax=Rhynchosporium graminicola TaxID=2792576 RepID=A0A1E1LLK1_9HELO|nr:uncharacterized protein RCO7_11540 [Rhynchosporium commune]
MGKVLNQVLRPCTDKVQGVYANAGKTDQGNGKLTKVLVTNPTNKYSILSILVRKYLQIPATSAPSERFFSLGALIINKLRNRLTKDTFEMISLLKSWGFIIDIEEKDKITSEEVVNNTENFFIID